MGNGVKNKRENKFVYKSLLIFTGICTLVSALFLGLLGYTINILEQDAFGMYGGLIISVPFAVHIYCWGLFCEWKNIKILPIVLKVLAIIWTIVLGISYILFLCGV